MHSLIDDQGRYIFLLCKLAGVPCIIANIYVPPPFSPDSLNKLAQFMAQHSNVPLLALGDINTVMDKVLDWFPSQSRGGTLLGGPTPFAKLMRELGLRDVWRDRNPTVQCF